MSDVYKDLDKDYEIREHSNMLDISSGTQRACVILGIMLRLLSSFSGCGGGGTCLGYRRGELFS